MDVVLLILGLLGLVILIVGLFAFGGGLTWFAREEETQKRSLDLKLWVAENGWEFEKDSHQFKNLLRASSCHFESANGIPKNVAFLKENMRTLHIFDYFVRTYELDSTFKLANKEQSLQGMLIHFEDQHFPNFNISKSGSYSNSGYVQINRDAYPLWIPSYIDIFAGRHDADEIVRFISENKQLSKLITNRYFSVILFRRDKIAVYFDGLFFLNSANLTNLVNKAKIISTLKSNKLLDDYDEELKMLKREEKNS